MRFLNVVRMIISDEKRQRIRTLLAEGWSERDVEKTLKVSKTAVNRIKREASAAETKNFNEQTAVANSAKRKRRRLNDFGVEKSLTVAPSGETPTTMIVRTGTTDVTVLNEIFVKKYYAPKTFHARMLLESNQSWFFVDIGGNIGCAAVWFAQRYNTKVIIAVEPSVDNLKIMRKNLVAHGVNGKTRVKKNALVPHDHTSTVATLRIATKENNYNHYRHTLLDIPSMDTCPTLTVSTIKLSEIFACLVQRGPVFLKLDCEGAETWALQELPDVLAATNGKHNTIIIVGEYIWDYIGKGINDYRRLFDDFETNMKNIEYFLTDRHLTAPPYGAEDDGFVRRGVSAASRFEMVFVRRNVTGYRW